MKELFEICPKAQLLTFFGVFFSFEGGEFDQKSVK